MTKHTRYSVDNKIYVYVLNASCHLKATQSRIICRVLAPDGVRFLKNKALTTATDWAVRCISRDTDNCKYQRHLLTKVL